MTIKNRLEFSESDAICMDWDVGISGWFDSPDSKVDVVEMQTGNGAHAPAKGSILYSTRTVTIGFIAFGANRSTILDEHDSLARLLGEMVRIRVVDSGSDTYSTGYATLEWDSVKNGPRFPFQKGKINVVCPDPRRLSTETRRIQLMPASSVSGGLYYGSKGSGLKYDLNYGGNPSTMQNVGTLENDGTSEAYPVITVNGPIEQNMRVDWDGGAIAYSMPVQGVPLTLDSLSRTASIAGLDVSRHLTSRVFPSVPAGGSISVNFQSVGTGWATIEWHDTYI